MRKDMIKLLILEDNPADAELVVVELKRGGVDCKTALVSSENDFVRQLRHFQPDIVLADYRLPGFTGLDALRLARQQDPLVGFIIITGSLNEQTAIECLKAGADDYVLKDALFKIPHVVDAVYSRLEIRRDRQKALTELRESEKKFRAVFEQGSFPMVMTDRQGRLTDVNNSFLNLFEYSRDELIGSTYLKITFPEDAEASRQMIMELQHSQKNYMEIEKRYLAKSGRVIWSRTGVSVIRDENGQVINLIGLITDITQIKRAQMALEESEKQYRLVVENANDAILILREGKIRFHNSRFCQFTGYEQGELPGVDFLDLVMPEEREAVRQFFQDCEKFPTTRPTEIQCRLSCATGKEIWAEISATPIQWKGRNSLLCFISNITDRKKITEEKELIQKQLYQAQKMEAVGALAGGVAHDFNNILTTIQGYADLSLLELDESSTLYRNLKQIQRAARRAGELTGQLLLFSRKQPMKFQALNLNDVINNLMKMLKRLIGEQIEIITELSGEIWPIKADAGNLEQVLMNLAINARDAMPDGGVLRIRTQNEILTPSQIKINPDARPGKYVQLMVMDTGQGIPPEILPEIFNPFFTTKEAGKGTGLGLSVVYGIVKQHGGWIEVGSTVGKGTIFTIYLPATSEKPEPSEEKKESLVAFQGKGQHVLLVEDERAILNFSRGVLREQGYRITAVGSVGEALRLLANAESGTFDLLFTDVVLPDGNGVQLADLARESFPDLPVILTSGYTDEKVDIRYIQKKKYYYLPKPYNMLSLLKTIHKVLKTAGKV